MWGAFLSSDLVTSHDSLATDRQPKSCVSPKLTWHVPVGFVNSSDLLWLSGKVPSKHIFNLPWGLGFAACFHEILHIHLHRALTKIKKNENGADHVYKCVTVSLMEGARCKIFKCRPPVWCLTLGPG